MEYSEPAAFSALPASTGPSSSGPRNSTVPDFMAVWFEAANFANDAWFGGAQFHVTANFRKAHFGRRASFGSDGRLGPARFYQSVDFADAVFSRPPELAGALVRPQAPSDLRRVWPPEWCPRSPDDAESEWQELAVFGPPL